MALIVVWTFFVTLGLWLFALPLFYLALKRQRTTTVRNFALTALFIGVICGSLAFVSDRQMAQCAEAGIAECVDAGAAGMQFTLIVFYVLITWLTAYALHRD
jgi:hypothetical protein